VSTPTPLQRTRELGAEFWNDSCALGELTEAVAAGASGATSNPVIVAAALAGEPERWTPVMDRLIRDLPRATEDEIAWEVISELGRAAAKVLQPVFEASGGQSGYLSMQVNPKYHRDPDRMFEHGRQLAALAPNIAIKAPATDAGLEALRRLTAAGVVVNATVSFSVSQALAVAELLDGEVQPGRRPPWVTLMVGRVDDHLKRVIAAEGLEVSAEVVQWAGVAVFKKAHALFQRRGHRCQLLAAAYRNQLQWTELVGPGVVLTMPYPWWKKFNASGVEPEVRIELPVPDAELHALQALPEFRRAWDEGGLKREEFERYGASIHTLNQFLTSYQELLTPVRARILGG
jgi:transaldolase